MTFPRKSVEHRPYVQFWLRDAEPLASELNNPDPAESSAARRRQSVAVDGLLGMYVEAWKAGALSELDSRVKQFCEELADRNGGKLPTRKGGRPLDEDRRLQLWLKVHDAVEAGVGVVKAMEQVAEKAPCSYEAVRAIFYNDSPEWAHLTKATLALARLEKEFRSGTLF